MLFIQMSDLHVGLPGEKLSGIVDTPAMLRRAVERVVAFRPRPEAVLLTGDLVNDCSAAEYRYLRELLAPIAAPIYPILGNHDGRDAMRAAFSDCGFIPESGPIQYVIDDHPVRLIALDSNVADEPHGVLDAAGIAWLSARLEESTKPTMLMIHHPPFTTGIGFMDKIALREGIDELTALLERHGQVQRVLCGHVHRAIERRLGRSIVMTCPATCHQIPLELETSGPEAFSLEPPGLRVHWWDGQEMVTHTLPLGEFPPPHPF